MVLMELAVTVAVKVLLEFIREQLELLEINTQLAAVPVQETDQHDAVYRPIVPGK